MRGRVERDCIETCENVVRSGAIIKFVDFDSSTSTFTGYSDIAVRFSYSNLSAFFIKDSGRSVYCCSIFVEGTSYQIYQLSPEELWHLIKEKSFRVVVDNDVYQLIGNLSGELTLNTRSLLLSIFKSKESGDDIDTGNLLKLSTCYQFEEVDNPTQ